MPVYTLITARYFDEVEFEYDTLDEALDWANAINESGEGYPLEILEDGAVLWSNRGGHPLVDGTCPLFDRIEEWRRENGYDD